MRKRNIKLTLRRRRELGLADNPIVTDLHSGKYQQRVVVDKTKYTRKGKHNEATLGE